MSPPDPEEPLEFVITEADDGARLDQIVLARLSGAGRRSVGSLFASGSVTLEGRPARKGERGRAGASVRVGAPPRLEVLPEPLAALDVRFENADVIVVEKPAGQPTVPIRSGEAGTLAGALLGRYAELAGVGYRPREPGLLHRLDTETSGLVVAARSPEAFTRLRAALTEGRIEKRYLAIVLASGLAGSGEITAPLGPDPRDGRRVTTAPGKGVRARPATTAYLRLEVRGDFALVLVTVSRAYRHQVRAHLAHAGHPLAGDSLYGGPAVPALGARHALHASYVAWAGDGGGSGFAVESALPADLAALLAG